MDNKKEIIVELNPNNIGKLQALLQNVNNANEMVNDFIRTVLDAKEIDYTKANTSIKDFKIVVEQINQTPG